MSTSLFTIADLDNFVRLFNPMAKELGFGSVGEIDRFLFGVYGKAVRNIQPADRARGTIFVLEPASVADALDSPAAILPFLTQIHSERTTTLHSLCLDLAGGLIPVCPCTPTDRKSLVSGAWPQQVAQRLSRAIKKCVVWAEGVGAVVFINGDIYLSSVDVVEGLAAGWPAGFTHLSWDDGGILFEFARCELNDRGSAGIWQLPDMCLLRPKPETVIRSHLGKFLRFRLAGYQHHAEEPYVENEGRADIVLHIVNGRILIVEVKWIGRSLVATHIGASEKEIKTAITNNKRKRGWLTKFDDTTILAGIRQLVQYYATGRYERAYLAVFDCTASAKRGQSCYVPVPTTELDGHSETNFRILRACVDPRTASKKAKS